MFTILTVWQNGLRSFIRGWTESLWNVLSSEIDSKLITPCALFSPASSKETRDTAGSFVIYVVVFF